MADREKVINGLTEIVNFFDIMSAVEGRCNELKQDAKDAIALLKQEEKPLRCDKCSCHREDGWCGMHGRWVTETDYCSLGMLKGR